MASHGLDSLSPLTTSLPVAPSKAAPMGGTEAFVQLLLATDFQPAAPPPAPPASEPRTESPTAPQDSPPAEDAEPVNDAPGDDDTSDEESESSEEAAVAQPALAAVPPQVEERPSEVTRELDSEDAGADELPAQAVEQASDGDAPATERQLPQTAQQALGESVAAAEETPEMSAHHRSPQSTTAEQGKTPQLDEGERARSIRTKKPSEEQATSRSTRPQVHAAALRQDRSATPAETEPAETEPAAEITSEPADRREPVRRTSKPARREATGDSHFPRVPPPHVQRAAESQLPPHAAATAAPVDASPATTETMPTPAPAAEAPVVTNPASPATSQRLPDHLLTRRARPTPTATSLTPAQQTRFVQRVAGAIEAARSRDGHVRIRLSPPELGALKLEIKVEDGVLNARIEAETEIAKTALVENFPALRERLAEQGIRIENFQVDVPDHRGENPQAHDAPHQDRQSRQRDQAATQRRASDTTGSVMTASEAGPPVSTQQQLNVII